MCVPPLPAISRLGGPAFSAYRLTVAPSAPFQRRGASLPTCHRILRHLRTRSPFPRRQFPSLDRPRTLRSAASHARTVEPSLRRVRSGSDRRQRTVQTLRISSTLVCSAQRAILSYRRRAAVPTKSSVFARRAAKKLPARHTIGLAAAASVPKGLRPTLADSICITVLANA